MKPHVGALYEGFAANGAHIRFLPRVGPVMRVACRLVTESDKEQVNLFSFNFFYFLCTIIIRKTEH